MFVGGCVRNHLQSKIEDIATIFTPDEVKKLEHSKFKILIQVLNMDL